MIPDSQQWDFALEDNGATVDEILPVATTLGRCGVPDMEDKDMDIVAAEAAAARGE